MYSIWGACEIGELVCKLFDMLNLKTNIGDIWGVRLHFAPEVSKNLKDLDAHSEEIQKL